MGKTLLKLIFFLLPSMAISTSAGDNIRMVTSLWDDFLAALRRGDYPAAYALFSTESREVFPYSDFSRHYGPLSAAREAVLARPESRSVRVEGDWAEIANSGVWPDSRRRFRVVAAAVQNQGSWCLVAAESEVRERQEAAAREVLRTAAAWRGLPDAAERLAELVAAGSDQPAFRDFVFQTDGDHFRALPKAPGFRAFHLDSWGAIRPGANPGGLQPLPKTPAAPMKTQPVTVPAPPPPASSPSNGLPELAEPPFLSGPGELPEPPAFPVTRPFPDPEAVFLPERIQ
ncbi:MAG: nuclear transport factor 2 family protein [Planctomycetota bacterium]|jgi:hypothetical protein|nr:nuclear transport factor 2 family protein [Planctomycetota bacterium]